MRVISAGLLAVREIVDTQPDVIVLMLTVYSHDELLFTAFQYGATDYLLKTSPRMKSFIP